MNESASEGLLELLFVLGRDGRTQLASRAQRFPLRFTAPMYLDPADRGMAFVYVQNPTGGLFAGDRLVTRIVAEAGARVHLTTPAATKVYRMEQGEARQRMEIHLGNDAYLEYVPEPLIPQAGSRLEQALHVELGEGAAFFGAEAIAPGRFARGEAFAYDRLLLRTSVSAGAEELCADTLLLEPAKRSPARRGLLGVYPYLGTAFAAAPRVDCEELADRLDESVRDAPGCLAGAGALPSAAGAFARVLASTSSAARSALERAWGAAREALIGSVPPARRK